MPVTVTVDGTPATVSYSGAAPGEVAGVLQINFQVPAGLAPGAQVPIVVNVGDIPAPAVTMALK
jgi:uncharacterized protein (TIGR03437 family)